MAPYNYLKKFLVLCKRHFKVSRNGGDVCDQVVLAQGLGCIKHSNGEWACLQNCYNFASEMSKEATSL